MRKRKPIFDYKSFLSGVAVGVVCAVIVTALIHAVRHKGSATQNSLSSEQAENGGPGCNCRTPQAIEAPLLPPPDFSKELPDEIEATKEGGAYVAWEPVPKALRYELVVTSRKGTRINRIKTPFLEATLKDLRTGEDDSATFYVSLASVNVDGKLGAFSKSKKVIVRDRPDITAPTIKSIKTED
jgi:hypothetical protein